MTPPNDQPAGHAHLPILDRQPEIEALIRAHQVVILTGETGSGKTTQLPQIIHAMRSPKARASAIAHTQPRRLAARAVAARIAHEMGVRLGELVGYKVRFDDRTSAATAIKVLTDGMLLAELNSDPTLAAYSTIILDEAHERSLNIDFLVGYLRDLLPRRPDLKLVITSATIEPKRFSDYFGGPAVAPIIEVSGRMFPVELRYRPASADIAEFENATAAAIVDAVEELDDPGAPLGDILVFLPGEREIRVAAEALRRSGCRAEILPLFSRLTNQEQDRIFDRPLAGAGGTARRRVILATNIAETSLTVPGIRCVIDTGLERRNFYDPARKVSTLPVVPVSRASANQRSGRCGRVAAGVCIRLYSEESYRERPAFTEPEIRRTNLASVILQMKSLGLPSIEAFAFLDSPDAAAVRDGFETLFELGAIATRAPDAPITGIGRELSRLPVDPRVGRMLVAAQREGCVHEVTILAAGLSIQDPRERPMERAAEADRAHEVFHHITSDFITLLNLWEQYRHAASELTSGPLVGWCRDHFLNPARMREWAETIRQLTDLAVTKPAQDRKPATDAAIHRALLPGLISNLACRDDAANSWDYKGVKGNIVSIFPGSVMFKKGAKWIMAAEIVRTTRLYGRTVARVEPEWIEELAGHMLDRQLTDPHLDTETGVPSAWERSTMNGIVVVPRRRVSIAATDAAKARELFIREALIAGKWTSHDPYVLGVRVVLESALALEAKFRRRDVLKPASTLAEWFDTHLPSQIRDPESLIAWHSAAGAAVQAAVPILADVLRGSTRSANDPSAFPDELVLAESDAPRCLPLAYALAPGTDADGLTATISLTDLPALTETRASWLVPGMLTDLAAALIRLLPKASRALVDAKGDLAAVASSCAGVMDFAQGPLAESLSEALEVLHNIKIAPDSWSFRNLPAHLVLRVRVIDSAGKEIAVERDLVALQERLESKVRKARAAGVRARFDRDGIQTWDMGTLPESVAVDHGGERLTLHPAVVDQGDRVTLTLVETTTEAASLSARGVRRLFALACREQVNSDLASLAQWADLVRWHNALGSTEQLRDGLTCLIAERAFITAPLTQAALIRTEADFDDRLQAGWGRLAQVTRDVADIVARTLDPRFAVAQRLARGTNRNWAASLADIREQAAYLMPAGFLSLAAWEHLRDFPRFAQGMKERLLSLREDGSGSDKDLMALFAPHWKKYTGWVAAAMSAQRQTTVPVAQTHTQTQTQTQARATPTKAPLPQARRAAPTINLDAGEWAMQPGKLPAAVEQYRWALEEFRLALFAPPLAGKPPVTAARIESLWKAVSPP